MPRIGHHDRTAWRCRWRFRPPRQQKIASVLLADGDALFHIDIRRLAGDLVVDDKRDPLPVRDFLTPSRAPSFDRTASVTISPLVTPISLHSSPTFWRTPNR
jgi:hypothetical protein